MKKPTSSPGRSGMVRCPVCGNRVGYAVYVASLRVHHVTQAAAGRWRHVSADPSALEVRLPLLMVCADCAQPLGQPPRAALSVLPNRPGTR